MAPTPVAVRFLLVFSRGAVVVCRSGARVLPAAEDGVVLLIVDGTYKEKTAKKHPLVKKARLDTY